MTITLLALQVKRYRLARASCWQARVATLLLTFGKVGNVDDGLI